MIKSKPAALPSYCVSTYSLTAIVAYTVEVTLRQPECGALSRGNCRRSCRQCDFYGVCYYNNAPPGAESSQRLIEVRITENKFLQKCALSCVNIHVACDFGREIPESALSRENRRILAI